MKDQHYDPFSENKEGLFRRKEAKSEADKTAVEDKDAIREPLDEQDAENTAEAEKTAQDLTPVPTPRRRRYPISAMVAAGFWIRFVAFLLDAAIASAFSTIFTSPFNALFAADDSLLAKAVSGFFFYLYFVLSTYVTNGQTLGKIIVGIRVIHPAEARLSLTTVIIREGFCRMIQTIFFPLYGITAFAERKRNLGDFLSDTFVVDDALYAVEKKEGELFYAYEN